MMNNTIVSVPSRGNGVIDVLRKTANEPWTVEVGFRPLSGKWGYRFDAILSFEDSIALVSVPSRGNGVIDCQERTKGF